MIYSNNTLCPEKNKKLFLPHYYNETFIYNICKHRTWLQKKKKEKKKFDKVLSFSHVQTGFSLKTNPKGFFQYEATM